VADLVTVLELCGTIRTVEPFLTVHLLRILKHGQHADARSVSRRHDRDIDRHVQITVPERHASGKRQR
jgi:hypothetical protein